MVSEALQIIVVARLSEDQPLLFPSARGMPMSDATMARFMEREGYVARPHGFHATCRTWVEECTDTPFEVKESALEYKVDAGVIGAYQRSDRLDKRRLLMEKWAEFLNSGDRL